jgi:DUF1365 family protein
VTTGGGLLPATAFLYECQVRHVRAAPLRNVFRYRTYQWLVDLDDVPALPAPLRPLADFRAADHFGQQDDPGCGIRQKLDGFLAARGIDLAGGKVTMLAHARVLGHVFNPLTLYWCHGPGGSLECVVAEVHNTYGQRHCYLMRTDDAGRAQVPKAFYVSPFYPVDGWYQMALPEPGARLAVTVTLHRPDGSSFVASVRGQRRPATLGGLLRAAVRHPAVTAAVSGRIRWQGIRLYARGLRPAPRPGHVTQEGVR